jgi:hypothetical protein
MFGYGLQEFAAFVVVVIVVGMLLTRRKGR